MIEDEGNDPFARDGADFAPPVPPPLPGVDAAEGPGTAESAPETGPIPWEDADGSFPRNLVASFHASLAAPARFFRALDPEVPFSRPILYYLIVSVAGALFSTLWAISGGGPAVPPELAESLGYPGLGEPLSRGWLLLEFFLSPFFALLGLAIWTLLVHPFCRLFSDSRRPISETGRVFCYAAGPAVLHVIPWVGGLAAFVGSLVLAVFGLRERHRTTTGRAIAALLVPAVGLGILLTALFLFSLAVLGSLGDLALP